MAISGSGALGGAASGAATGAMFGPWGMAIGAGVGGLMGLFSGKSLSKEEKAILGQLDAMAKQQQGYAGDLMKEGKTSAAKAETKARGVRSPANAQAQNYWSSMLGGDRAKMMSASAPARQSVADTYRGGRRSLERSNLRGAQKEKAESELARQETGQLAGLVQGVQPMAAQELAGMENNIQQLMAQYFGIGEQAKASGAYSAASMLGGASDNYKTMLGSHQGLRAEQSANDKASGGAFGDLIGPLAQLGAGYMGGRGGTILNNGGKVGPAPTPGGWTIPKGTLMGSGAAPKMTLRGPDYGPINYANMTVPKARNPWGGVGF